MVVLVASSVELGIFILIVRERTLCEQHICACVQVGVNARSLGLKLRAYLARGRVAGWPSFAWAYLY